jgi:hypothetical protein
VLLHEHLIEQGFLDDFHGDIHPAMCAAAQQLTAFMWALQRGNPFLLESIQREAHNSGAKQTMRSGQVAEKICRVGKSAVDEFNGARRASREPVQIVGDDTYGDFSAVALFPVRVAEAQTDQRMDHLDKLGYAFLGFCVAVFLPCIIAIYRSKQEQFL